MSEFKIWFSTGVEHIVSLDALDHILFVTLLVIAVPTKEWKRILILITGFTAGHAIALLLTVSGMVRINSALTEFLIAFTILITSAWHILQYRKNELKKIRALYFLIPLFGGIHGLGFAGAVVSMLGQTSEAAVALLYFNIGVEAGQVMVALAVAVFSLLLTAVIKCPFHYFKLIVSCLIAVISLFLLAARFSF